MDVMSRRRNPFRWGRLVLALWVAALTFVAGTSTAVSAAVDRHEQARSHMESGELRTAVIELKNRLQEAPEDAEARWLLGRTYLRMGRPEAAEKEFRRAAQYGRPAHDVAYWRARAILEQGDHARVLEEMAVDEQWPPDVRARLAAVRAQALIRSGRSAEAQSVLDAHRDLDPGNIEARLARIQLELMRNRPERAASLGEDAVEAYPDTERTWTNLARAHLASGALKEAEGALDEAIERAYVPYEQRLLRARIRLSRGAPEGARADIEWLRENLGDHASVRFAEGLLAAHDGREKDACGHFADALSQAPGLRQAQYYVGLCKYRSGDLNQAAENLEDAYQGLALPQVARVLAATYIAQERYERAREVLRPLMQMNADDAQAIALMASVERASGNTSEMISHLERLAELRPDNPRVRLELGYGLFSAGEADAGQAAFGDALAIAPGHGEAAAAVVISHIEQGDYDDAISAAEALEEELPDSALPWTLQGMALLARGDRDEALERVSTALEKEPSDPGARHLAGSLAVAEGDFDSARSHYEAVLEERPDHVDTLLRLARIEGRAGNPDRTGPLLRRAHESDPEALEPRLLLARYSIAQGDPEAALDMVRDPDRSVRNDPRALTIAAIALLEQAQPAQALEHLERLLASRAEEAQTYVLMARAYSMLGQEDEARKRLRQVLEFDADNPTVRVVQARARVRSGDVEGAREALERVAEENRALPAYLDARAEVALAAGDTRAAINYYERAQDAEPTSERATKLATIFLRTGRANEAETLLGDYLAEHGDDPAARKVLGDLYAAQGREDEAVEAYKRALDQDPVALGALNNLAWVLREREPAEALRYAEHAVNLQPDDPRVIDTLAMVLLELGRSDEAVEHMREAVSLAPRVPVLRYHFAQALVAADRREEARAQLKDALSGDASFAGVGEARALLEELAAEGYL